MRCCDDLRNAALADASIASIAARWGFRSRDAFTRLLRTSYGMTPQVLRAQALEQDRQARGGGHGQASALPVVVVHVRDLEGTSSPWQAYAA
ncbi:AraC family transcriptional regulator [Streptomyces coeruleorubidus]|uniref:AraC family transcriptional regulator n=1 Tax=Streptomyces coeruleorubidus TaxID=116188 RepID=UPI0033E25595